MIDRRYLLPMLILSAALPAAAQLDPVGSQVISYFPQLVDGGPAAQQWQTVFNFVNPNASAPAFAVMELIGDDGSALSLDFGNGPVSSLTFTIQPQGSAVFRTAGTSPSVSTGWAVVASTLPLEGVVQYHFSVNGKPQQGVSAQATPPSTLFRSPATISTGVAVANIFFSSIQARASALDASGKTVASTIISLGGSTHRALTVGDLFPGLSASFQGSLVLSSNNHFVAWTLSGDSGVLSSYPPSGLAWPVSHPEEIYKAWYKVLNAMLALYPLNPLPTLVIDTNRTSINSFADINRNEVHIFLNLAELISDSESELAFVVGHELGHIVQAQTQRLSFVPGNIEQDADQYGVYSAMLAGYDPYAGAGALAKLAMASGDAGLVSQNFDNLSSDPHGSFNTRLALMFSNMQAVCALPAAQTNCALYKSVIHPDLPGSAPLAAKIPKLPVPKPAQ